MYRRFEGPAPRPRVQIARGEFFRPPAPPLRMPYPGMYHPPLQYSRFHSHQLPAPSRPSFHHNFSNTYRHPSSSTNTLSSPHFAPRAYVSPSSFRSPHQLPLSTSSTSPSPTAALIVSNPLPTQSPITSCSSPSSLVASISSLSSTATSFVSCTPEPISSQVSLPAQSLVTCTSPSSLPCIVASTSSSSATTSSVSCTTPSSLPCILASTSKSSITTSSISSISLTSSHIPIFTQSTSSSCAAPSSAATTESSIRKRLRSSTSVKPPNDQHGTDPVQISSDSDNETNESFHQKKSNSKKRHQSNNGMGTQKTKQKKDKNWREEPMMSTTATNKSMPARQTVASPTLTSSITSSNRSIIAHTRVMMHNSSLDEKMVTKILSNVCQPGRVYWNDVCGLSNVKQRLKEMVVYPMLNPALFQGLRRPGRGLLLFGPPGTGKTLIGKCLATEARATFFSITSSSFGSKWYGESETLAKTLFECARALQPSIIFIDEVDSILKSARDTDGGCSTRLRTELLACMDGCTTTGKEEVLVVGATNWPGKIDEAARRRFTRRLYVPLPDEETRLEQFKHELSQEKHSISEDEFGLIAEKTKGYSGADITQVCRNAAMKPIRSLDPNGPSIEFITMDEVRPMNLSDFLESVNETTKSVSQEMIDQLEDFNNKFGSL